MSVKLSAKPNPDCDPTQGPCEMWLPGVYNVTFGKLHAVCTLLAACDSSLSSPVAICNGECGSKHPHSKVYDTASTKFTITGK